MSVEGKFKVTTSTPMGEMEMILSITANGDDYSGTIDSGDTVASLRDIEVDGNSFTCSFTSDTQVGELDIDMKGNVEGDKFTGEFITPFMPLDLEGERIKS